MSFFKGVGILPHSEPRDPNLFLENLRKPREMDPVFGKNDGWKEWGINPQVFGGMETLNEKGGRR